MRSHRAFPPGRGNLTIPVSSRGAARAGLALYAPCRPTGRAVRWVAWRMVDVLGAAALPGHPIEWRPPMDSEVWRALTSEWSGFVGPFDGVALHGRIQASRRGFAALLLAGGKPVGFVKVRDGEDAPLLNEFQALASMSGSELRFFEVPQPIATNSVEGWHYLLTTALRPELHRIPIAPPLGEITAEISSALGTLPRPAGTPQHWEPSHGDFAPWNLRQRRDGSLFLIDWEDAGWAPPGADEVYYGATVTVLGYRARNEQQVRWREAVAYWRALLLERIVDTAIDSDSDLSESLLNVFEHEGGTDTPRERSD